ncbi:MAG: hypothetical protein M3Z23_13595 [Acidobacteriota bacterium]|nr:hypothetical protein [Acidobacteriota bacterium]
MNGDSQLTCGYYPAQSGLIEGPQAVARELPNQVVGVMQERGSTVSAFSSGKPNSEGMISPTS